MPAPVAVLDRTELVVDNTDELARDEWLAYRLRGIGGSDAAAVAGLDNFRTAMHVYEEKRGTLPESELFDGNEKADWGHKLEPIIAAEFQAKSGLEVLPANILLRHPDVPFMLANVDRFVDDPTSPEGTALLEIKTTAEHNGDEWDDGPPYRAAIQANHYLAVTGLSRAYVAVLIGGQEFKYHPIDRDEELISALVSIEEDFWDRVQTGRPPPPVANDMSLLQNMWTARAGSELVVNEPEVMALLRRRQELIVGGKMIEEERKALENELRMLLGENEIAINSTGRHLFSWKAQGKTGFDHKQLLADYANPDVGVPWPPGYITKGTTRVLRVPKALEKHLLDEMSEG